MMGESSRQKLLESHFTVTQLTAQIQELQGKVKSMNDPNKFKTSNPSAVRDYPTFFLNQILLRVLVEIPAATTTNDLIHETYSEYQETFLKIQLHQVHRRHRFRKCCCMEEILSLHSTAPCF